MKNFLFILAAIFALTTSQAGADEGLYAGVFGGANWLEISNSRAKANFDVGYIVGGSIGYRWCGGLRLEGEIAYRNNQIKSAHLKRHHRECDRECKAHDSSSSKNDNRLKGHFHTVSYMANVLYDYPFECSPWKVYVGGGIGYATQKFSTKRHHHECEEVFAGSDYSNRDDSSHHHKDHKKPSKNNNSFAAQAIVGLGYNICDNFDLTVEYRYFYVGRHYNSNNNALVFGAQTGF